MILFLVWFLVMVPILTEETMGDKSECIGQSPQSFIAVSAGPLSTEPVGLRISRTGPGVSDCRLVAGGTRGLSSLNSLGRSVLLLNSPMQAVIFDCRLGHVVILVRRLGLHGLAVVRLGRLAAVGRFRVVRIAKGAPGRSPGGNVVYLFTMKIGVVESPLMLEGRFVGNVRVAAFGVVLDGSSLCVGREDEQSGGGDDQHLDLGGRGRRTRRGGPTSDRVRGGRTCVDHVEDSDEEKYRQTKPGKAACQEANAEI